MSADDLVPVFRNHHAKRLDRDGFWQICRVRCRLAEPTGPGEFGGGSKSFSFESELPEAWLPTIETRHGRADAQFHVIIATAWARDPHLVRDVAICSTTEL